MIFSSFWVGENEDKKKLKSCPPRVYWHDNMLDNMEHACIAPNLDELWTSRKLYDGIDIDNDEFGDEDTMNNIESILTKKEEREQSFRRVFEEVRNFGINNRRENIWRNFWGTLVDTVIEIGACPMKPVNWSIGIV